MSARDGQGIAEVLADVIAPHDAYRVNDDGWVVCICGHVTEGDDDDGSHARHVTAALLASPEFARVIADAKAEVERERDAAQEHLAYHLRDYALNSGPTGDLAVDMASWAGRLKERAEKAEQALADAEAECGERIAQAIEAARDKLHPAFSDARGPMPRGYTNAARIARAAALTEDTRGEGA